MSSFRYSVKFIALYEFLFFPSDDAASTILQPNGKVEYPSVSFSSICFSGAPRPPSGAPAFFAQTLNSSESEASQPSSLPPTLCVRLSERILIREGSAHLRFSAVFSPQQGWSAWPKRQLLKCIIQMIKYSRSSLLQLIR